MNISWERPIKVSSENYWKAPTSRGVYLWLLRINNTLMPYYVGRTNDVQSRFCGHLNFLLSGKYTIYEKEDLSRFFEYKQSAQIIKPLFLPDWPKNFPSFLKRRKELNEHIDFMIDCSEFSFAKIIEDETNNKKFKELEKKVISMIGIEKLANTRGGQSEISHLNMDGCNDIVQLF